MKFFSVIALFCLLFIFGCESSKVVLNPSPTFMSGDRKMIGIQGNIGILGPDYIADKVNKYMWHFWGTNEELSQKPFRVEAIELKTGKKHPALVDYDGGQIWERDGLGGPNNGADAHLPSNMVLPSSGLWQLNAYLGGKLKGTIIVDVKEK